MKLLTELLSAVFMNAFSKCGYDETLGKVSISDRLDLCQFQCNGALAGAKRYKKAPLMIAQEVANQITGCIYIYKIEVVRPGFLNISVKDEFLADYAEQMYHDTVSYTHLTLPTKLEV